MTRVFIIGYYGLGNIGDEVILDGIIAGVRKYIPDAEFSVISNNPSETRALHCVESVRQSSKQPLGKLIRNSLFGGDLTNIRREILSSDVVVLGGGSLLQDLHVYYLPIFYSLLKYAQLHSKITMIYGIGAGPITTSFGKRLTEKVLNKVDIVTVRDQMSYDVLSSCNVKDVVKTADPAFSVFSDLPENKYNINSHSTRSKNTFSVTAYNYLQDSDINRNNISKSKESLISKRKSFALLCDDIVETYDAEILFVPTVQSDLEGYQQISEMMSSSSSIASYSPDYRVSYNAISSSKLLIGMRLHSQILATMAGIPIVPISYCGKVKSYLKEIQLEDYYLDVEKLSTSEFRNKLIQNVGFTLSSYSSSICNICDAREKLCLSSLQSAELLSKVMEDRK